MQDLTATGILSLLETTKEQRQSFVASIISTIEDGAADPLRIHLQVKNTEDLIKQITSDERYRELCLEEAGKYGKKFEHHNAKFEIKEVGTKYDFSNCNDAKLCMLEQRAEAASKELKERQDWLKKMPQDGVIVTDELTGETEKVFPPAKTSTTSIAVSLK